MFVYTMVYETKGLALEEVNELYENEPRAWRSLGYRNQLRTNPIYEDHFNKSIDEDNKDGNPAAEETEKV